jgi:hypothetical protein
VTNAQIYNGNFIDIQPGIFDGSKYKITYGDCTRESTKPICKYQIEVIAQMGAAYILDLVNPPLSNTSVNNI